MIYETNIDRLTAMIYLEIGRRGYENLRLADLYGAIEVDRDSRVLWYEWKTDRGTVGFSREMMEDKFRKQFLADGFRGCAIRFAHGLSTAYEENSVSTSL